MVIWQAAFTSLGRFDNLRTLSSKSAYSDNEKLFLPRVRGLEVYGFD